MNLRPVLGNCEVTERIGPQAEIGLIRELVADGEQDYATLRAIEVLSRPGLPAPLRAELLNDLAVLRHGAGDVRAAQALLAEALALSPDYELARGNLEDVRAAPLPAEVEDRLPSRPGPEPRTINDWERGALEVAQQQVGLRGQRVLEIGGAIPVEVVRDLGALHWTAVDPQPEQQNTTGYEIHPGRVEDLPFASESFDRVFSSCAFEHLLDLDGALKEACRVLRPGGLLFSQFAPIWSCAIGHHLWLKDEEAGLLEFNKPIVPLWGHLLLTPATLQGFLEYGLGPRVANLTTRWIFECHYINRLFERDYRDSFERSGLVVRSLEPWGDAHPLGEGLRRALDRAHPEGGHFDVPGFRVVLAKPQ